MTESLFWEEIFILAEMLITGENRSNSKAELERVSEEYYMSIYKYCYIHLKSASSNSYDVTNEIFALLCEKWDSLENENIRAWLYRTADNIIKKFRRENGKIRKKLLYIEDLDQIAFNDLTYEQDFDKMSDDDIEKYKSDIMNELSGRDKELYKMVFKDKLPYSEICGRLHITRDTLIKRVYRFRQKIKKAAYTKIHK